MSSTITTLSQQKSFAQNFIKRVQCNAAGNLGGAISAAKAEVSTAPAGLWSNITSARAVSGGTRYRCFYFYNSHDSIYAENPIVYISQLTASPGDEVSIALGSSGVNGTEQSIANEFTAPTSVNFVSGTTRTSGLVLDEPIPPGGWFAVWVANTIKANAESYPFNNYKIRIEIADPAITYVPVNPPPDPGGGGTNPPPVQDVNIALMCAVGDTGNNADFDTVLAKMNARKPKSILTLGDNSYQTDATTWLTKLEAALTKAFARSKVHMCFGNEDWSATYVTKSTQMLTALINQYKNYFSYSYPYHAYTVENMRVIALHANSDGITNVMKGSPQYAFAQKELSAAYNDAKIDWIIVAMHHALFFPKTDTGIIPKTLFAGDYMPLFQQYGVHLLLFAHASVYVRFGVLQYNPAAPSIPTELLSGQAPNYSFTGQGFNNGNLQVGVGTGGALVHGFSDHIISSVPWQKASVADTVGYLYLETQNNGKKLHGQWFDKTDVMRDEFSITKS